MSDTFFPVIPIFFSLVSSPRMRFKSASLTPTHLLSLVRSIFPPPLVSVIDYGPGETRVGHFQNCHHVFFLISSSSGFRDSLGDGFRGTANLQQSRHATFTRLKAIKSSAEKIEYFKDNN